MKQQTESLYYADTICTLYKCCIIIFLYFHVFNASGSTHLGFLMPSLYYFLSLFRLLTNYFPGICVWGQQLSY